MEGPAPGGMAVSQGQAHLPREGGPNTGWSLRRRQMGREARAAAGQQALSEGGSWGSHCAQELVLHSQQALRPGPVTAKRDPTAGAGGGCLLWGQLRPPTTALLSAQGGLPVPTDQGADTPAEAEHHWSGPAGSWSPTP